MPEFLHKFKFYSTIPNPLGFNVQPWAKVDFTGRILSTNSYFRLETENCENGARFSKNVGDSDTDNLSNGLNECVIEWTDHSKVLGTIDQRWRTRYRVHSSWLKENEKERILYSRFPLLVLGFRETFLQVIKSRFRRRRWWTCGLDPSIVYSPKCDENNR